MSDHLTTEQLEQYGSRTLAPRDLLAVDDHLAECEECRQRAMGVGGPRAVVESLRGELKPSSAKDLDHPEQDQLVGYIEGTLDAVDREIVDGHLEFCADCAAEVAELTSFRAMLATFPAKEYAPAVVQSTNTRFVTTAARPSFRLAPVFAMAAAILIAAIVFKLNSNHGGGSPTSKPPMVAKVPEGNNPNTIVPSTTTTGESTGAPPHNVPTTRGEHHGTTASHPKGHVGEIHVAPVVRTIRPTHTENEEQMASNVPPAERPEIELPAAVRAVLHGKTLNLNTPEIRSLTGAGEAAVVGMAPAPPSFTVDAPVGTATLDARPTFTWEPAKDETEYKVVITDSAGAQVMEGPSVTQTSWRPEKELPRGELLKWQVKAYQNGAMEETVPDGGARFRVIEADRAQQIESAQKAFANDPLALGILYAQASLLDDAERSLAKAEKKDPGNASVSKLLDNVKAVRQNML